MISIIHSRNSAYSEFSTSSRYLSFGNMSAPESSNTRTKPPPTSRPSQKSMSKAERRELQEKQRAAKLLQKQTAGVASSAAGSPSPSQSKPKTPSAPSQKKTLNEINASGGSAKSSLPRDTSVGPSGVDDSAGGRSITRGLRIFSHFGLPKPVGHIVKGDIHPAVIRLGLLFSEFRICGANARCIATLTALKNVCLFMPP